MSHPLSLRAIALAHQFRLGKSVAATQTLPTLLQETLTERGGLPTELVAAMLLCQERQDWLGLADYLEYELVQTLMQECFDE
ncbi:hypothetical protein D3C87_1719160 [compost metagenome]|jgi:hypothetical protein|uniref:hypothetical protein n=1 Tax=Aeromonas rivipollensis TaxID=948519 RepID=UPI000FC29CE6|nr:hypothetical protein [Aeromonas rivipollensis]MCE9955449.1 hypothetical protein [Aeromonas rivipollensis]